MASATAISSVSNGGPALAIATGGNGRNGDTGGNGGLASAIATSTAMRSGAANASATATGGNGGAGSSAAGIAGAANANSFATTINDNTAHAQSTAAGSSGQAQATAQTNFANLNSVQTTATSQVGGSAPASANAQVGGVISLQNATNPGQSFSATKALTVGPSMIAFGSMGAGGIGASLTYQESANFTFNAIGGGLFLIDPLNNFSLGSGFNSALFQILLNGNVFESQSFNNLASAQAFFSPSNFIDLQLAAGLNNIQLAFNETMSGGEAFGFDYAVAGISAAPLPPSWTMMLIGLVGLAMIAYRRQKNGAAVIADT
jgi:hypothetical protein